MERIGEQVRRLRKERNWSLEELSQRSGLSISFLSQVERGQTSLSISSLKAIADAFGEPLYHFFPLPLNSSSIVRAGEAKWVRIEGSEVRYGILGGPLDGKVLEPLLVELPPHYEGPPPFAHEGEEFGYVLEGSLTLIFQDEIHELNAGDSVHFLSRIPHTWKNLGDVPVRAIWVVTPKIISYGGGEHEP
jgi:transcriptional regulator with XRE-family HTH domain